MPSITAKPHPKMMTGQVFAPILKSPKTATQPSPKRMRTIVPKNSPMASPIVPARAEVLPAICAMRNYSISVTMRTTICFPFSPLDSRKRRERKKGKRWGRELSGRSLFCGLRPTLSTLHSTLPVGVQLFALLLAHLGLKGAVNGPLLSDFLGAFPEAHSQTCQICSAESGCLCHLGSLHRNAQNVCLELHQQVVDNCAPVNAQGLDMHTAISRHRLKHITRLIAHRLQRCTSNMTRS